MEQPKLDKTQEQMPKNHKDHNFEVVRNFNGTYNLYFTTRAEAEDTVRNFWATRDESGSTTQSLQSGMLHPFNHEITNGDRTMCMEASPSQLLEHPGKQFIVHLNGNTGALNPKGVSALRQLGFIE